MKQAIFILIGVALYFIVFHWSGSDSETQTQAEKPPPYKVSSYSAKRWAKELIKERLVSPSTAKFKAVREIASRVDGSSQSHFYLFYAAVDSQNSFGAMIRSYFLIPFVFKDGDAEKVFFSKLTPYITCEPQPTEEEILVAKALVRWPN